MYRVLKIDESEHITDPEFLERCGGKVYSVYLYNDQEVTHCCELTPSYWLYEVDVIAESYPEDPEESDKLYEDLRYCRNDQGGIYIHCHSVDSMKSEEFGEFEDDDEAIEAYTFNPIY